MLCRVPAYSAPIFPNPTIRYFIRYRLGLCRRTARCTGYAHCADGRRSRSDEFQVLECKVAYEDGLADTQFGYVHDQFVGQVLDQRAHDELTGRQRQLTADLHTFGVTRQAYRNGDGYGFTLGNAVEIEVEDLLADGVELRLTQHGLFFLAVEIELDDVRVGGVDQGLDLAGSTEKETDSPLPDSTQGTMPSRRTALAAFLPYSSRLTAFTEIVFIIRLFLMCYHRRFSARPRKPRPNSACFGSQR